jgi:hypothetical protein
MYRLKMAPWAETCKWHFTTNKLNYAQWNVSELIDILLCLTEIKAQYIVHNKNRWENNIYINLRSGDGVWTKLNWLK